MACARRQTIAASHHHQVDFSLDRWLMTESSHVRTDGRRAVFAGRMSLIYGGSDGEHGLKTVSLQLPL